VFTRRWRESSHGPAARNVWAYATADKFPDVELVTDSPEKRNLVFERHRERVRSARRRVWMENAYFCPPQPLLDDLFAAAQRGVDVKIIVPGETDLPSIRRAARADYAEWIARGVGIYEYQPTVLHAKFALVDDDWTTVGTFNANPTSLRWANEANLFVRDERFAREAEQVFLEDLAWSREVDTGALATRPVLETIGDGAWKRIIRWLEPPARALARRAA
jgi:cardiolipin synthase